MHTLKHKEGRQSATIEKNPTTNSSLKKRLNNYTMYISHLYRREHDIQKNKHRFQPMTLCRCGSPGYHQLQMTGDLHVFIQV